MLSDQKLARNKFSTLQIYKIKCIKGTEHSVYWNRASCGRMLLEELINTQLV